MKIRKIGARLLAVILITALLLPLAGSAFAASYPYGTTSMDDVNLRKRANSTSTIIKKIQAGDTVKILGVTGNYYKVEFDGKTGYAMKKFIDGTDPSPDTTPEPGLTMQAPPAVTAYPYDTTVISTVKMRKKAKVDAEVTMSLLPDAVVTVQSLTDNGFAKVKYNGKTGYVLASNINLAAMPTPIPKGTAAPQAGSEKFNILQSGSVGVEVTAIQSALTELGFYTGSVDGKYGTVTADAVKTFQKRNGYTQDGIVTPAMQVLIYDGTPKDTKGYRQYVKTLAPVAGATIKENSVGEAVNTLQIRLKELGYYSGDVTGTCDKATVAAIKDFQAKHSLVESGIMDATYQEILYSSIALGASAIVTPTPAPTLAPPTGAVRRGDKSDDATLVQQRLQELGYYTGKITGTFNEASESALKAFQKKSSIEADGVCGPVTRTVLFGINAVYAIATAMPIVTQAPLEDTLTEENAIIIMAGTRGDVVLKLQTKLQELGYYTSRLDGVYLTDDITAVREFQSANALKVDGKAGFLTQSALYSGLAIAKTAILETEVNTALRYGSTGAEVSTLQNKLIELGYLTGQADGIFGIITKKALISFQRANSLDRDGVAGTLTLAALNGKTVVTNTVTSSTSIKFGAVGDEVKTLQSRLVALGYLKGSADGKFGVETSLALIAFQKANSLTADGIAGSDTLSKLNNQSAVSSGGSASTTTTAGAPSVSSNTVSAANVRYANWYTEVRARCKLYPNATVYDFVTGISWQVNMFSLGAHADAEPLTAADTANMNKAFGGKATWTAKAVWVVFSDGRVYMASTHNYPHSPSHIRNNNFDGHLCIHFPRTESQVTAIGPYATKHQREIELGWAATLKRAGS